MLGIRTRTAAQCKAHTATGLARTAVLPPLAHVCALIVANCSAGATVAPAQERAKVLRRRADGRGVPGRRRLGDEPRRRVAHQTAALPTLTASARSDTAIVSIKVSLATAPRCVVPAPIGQPGTPCFHATIPAQEQQQNWARCRRPDAIRTACSSRPWSRCRTTLASPRVRPWLSAAVTAAADTWTAARPHRPTGQS